MAALATLTEGVDDSFWNAQPTPTPSPVKRPIASSALSFALPRTPKRTPREPPAKPAKGDHDMSEFLAGCETWDLDTDPFTPIKASRKPRDTSPIPVATKLAALYASMDHTSLSDTHTRCVVSAISEDTVNGKWTKTVQVHVYKEPKDTRTVYLQDDWLDTRIQPGDIINVLGNWLISPYSPPAIFICSQSNLIITHPDLLLTATSLSNAPQCTRKPLLTTLVRGANDVSAPMVWGNMLHEVFQRCLLQCDEAAAAWTPENIEKLIDEVILENLTSLVLLGLSEDTARATLKQKAAGLPSFAERYLGPTPRPEGTLSDTRARGRSEGGANGEILAISRIHNIEEDIWSPKYGLKGKVDVTVEAVVASAAAPSITPKAHSSGFFKAAASNRAPFPATNQGTMSAISGGPRPFEIKTGKTLNALEHRAQTMLYTLLTGERYGTEVDKGLLYYTQGEDVVQVPRGRNEIRGLIVLRNELAAWSMVRARHRGAPSPPTASLADDSMDVDRADEDPNPRTSSCNEEQDLEEAFLPAPIDSDHTCKRCYVLDTCMLYRFALSTPTTTGDPSTHSPTDSTTSPPLPTLESPPRLISGLAETYELKTSHLTPLHGLFFRTWERLLSLEESNLVRWKSELWRMGSGDREKAGRCLGGMVMVNEGQHIKTQDEPPISGAGENTAVVEETGSSKIHKFTYTFSRSPLFTFFPTQASQVEGRSTTLLNGHLSVGDAISISVEPTMLAPHVESADDPSSSPFASPPVNQHTTIPAHANPLLALSRGFILKLTEDTIVVGVDSQLDLAGLAERIEVIRKKIGISPPSQVGVEEEKIIFRIDKDELFGGMARLRSNLAHLFFVGGDSKRRELVVDLRAPVFAGTLKGTTIDTPSSTSDSQPRESASLKKNLTGPLNPSQRRALHHVLNAQDYALILGMPGTGKTTVVAALIRVLVDMGKSVLLSSYTHSAVDSILRKLPRTEEEGVEWQRKVLRLGNVDKIHPDALKYTIEARPKATTVAQLEEQWMSPPVVAATCLGVDHPLFTKRKFDYCIVDEASQITLPTCLGPLRHAETFVLVGDHYQLPPLVKNPLARSEAQAQVQVQVHRSNTNGLETTSAGLDISLFRRLSAAHPQSVVDLTDQYRMNEDIMLLSNRLIYDGRLRCGDKLVAERTLELGCPGALGKMHRILARQQHQSEGQMLCGGDDNHCWLEHLLNPSTKAVFVNTDSLGDAGRDSRQGDLVQNLTEASLVVQFVEALVRSGVTGDRIGVITLYRQQVKVLAGRLAELARRQQGQASEKDSRTEEKDNAVGMEGVEVLTADKSQGRDKDCIIISLVRNNVEGQIGELVKDWRRMNVSFTRARSKLVIFGSRSTLEKDSLLRSFFDLMDEQEWIYELPADAHLNHGPGPWESVVSGDIEMAEAILDPPAEQEKTWEHVVSKEVGEVREDIAVIDLSSSSSPPTILSEPKRSTPLKRVADAMEEDSEEIEVVQFRPRARPSCPKGKGKAATAGDIIDINSDSDGAEEEVVLPNRRRGKGKQKRTIVDDGGGDEDDDVIIVSPGPVAISSSSSSARSSTKPTAGKPSAYITRIPSAKKRRENPSSSSTSTSSTTTAAASSVTPKAKKPKAPKSKQDTAISNAPSSSSKGEGSRTKQTRLDGWFSKGPAASSSSSSSSIICRSTGAGTSSKNGDGEPPRKIPRKSDMSDSMTIDVDEKKNAKKVGGIVKGRPILYELVKNAT